jgi:hypothetical protein
MARAPTLARAAAPRRESRGRSDRREERPPQGGCPGGKGETYLYREREVGKFVRTLRLPFPIEEGKIDAAYQDGILTVHVPKAATAVSKKVLIK